MAKLGLSEQNKPLDTSHEVAAEYAARWPAGGAYVVSSRELPSFLFEQCGTLMEKVDRAAVLALGRSGGPIDYLFALVRVDEKAGAFKIHPVIVRFFSGGIPSLSGCHIQHANFSGRDFYFSGRERDQCVASRSGSYFPDGWLPATVSGRIEDLPKPLLNDAYRCAARWMSGC